MMPFRIPADFRKLQVATADPGEALGGSLKVYVRWLRKELKSAEAALDAAEEEREEHKADTKPGGK